jgi:hypothetical protein
MAISMRVQKESGGESIVTGQVAWMPPRDVLDPHQVPLLAGVDAYGQTIFNGRQCERQLPSEIAYLRDRLHSDDEVKMLDELERLATETIERPHRYLWFLGD